MNIKVIFVNIKDNFVLIFGFRSSSRIPNKCSFKKYTNGVDEAQGM